MDDPYFTRLIERGEGRTRWRGQGVEKGERVGDQFVAMEIQVPEELTDEQREKMAEFADVAGLRH